MNAAACPCYGNAGGVRHTGGATALGRRMPASYWAGAVAYPTHTVEVPEVGRQGEFARNLASLIRRLASDTPPQRTPSAHECRFCDISSADYPERVNPELEAWTAAWHLTECCDTLLRPTTLQTPLPIGPALPTRAERARPLDGIHPMWLFDGATVAGDMPVTHA